ncbi:MAG: PaaI family thioesterase [Deltaproteobacteria bacterium]|nr:PaaI family thioesterase [Deltaproteobacteria bacterium]
MKEYLKKVRQPGQSVNPLFAYLGVVVDEISPGRTVMHLPFRPDFIQGGGTIAGGIIATLADEAMAHAALAGLSPGETTATIEMNIRYLKACPSGAITATAALIKKGRRVMTLQAELTDDNRQTVALAGASFMVLPKKE